MDRIEQETESAEMPDTFWNKVYLGVVAVTIVVITALWAFSRYFSS